MSSTTVSMPRLSATRRPSRRLSGSESRLRHQHAEHVLRAERGDARAPPRRWNRCRRRGRARRRAGAAGAAPARGMRCGDARASASASRRSAVGESSLRRLAIAALSCRAAFIVRRSSSVSAICAPVDLAVLGSSAARRGTRPTFGTMKSSRMLRAVADHVVARRASAPGSSATTALIAMPSTGSGTPTTAASRMPGSA